MGKTPTTDLDAVGYDSRSIRRSPSDPCLRGLCSICYSSHSSRWRETQKLVSYQLLSARRAIDDLERLLSLRRSL
jgi:hypothetical protein